MSYRHSNKAAQMTQSSLENYIFRRKFGNASHTELWILTGSTGKKGVWMKANYRQFLIQLNKVKLTASNSKMWPFLHLKYIFTLCKVFNYAHSYQIPSICKSWVTCIKNKEKKKKRVDCCSLQTPVRTFSYAFIFFPRHIKNQSQGKNLLYSLHSFYSLLYLYFKTGISGWHISQKCYSKSVEILVL